MTHRLYAHDQGSALVTVRYQKDASFLIPEVPFRKVIGQVVNSLIKALPDGEFHGRFSVAFKAASHIAPCSPKEGGLVSLANALYLV